MKRLPISAAPIAIIASLGITTTASAQESIQEPGEVSSEAASTAVEPARAPVTLAMADAEAEAEAMPRQSQSSSQSQGQPQGQPQGGPFAGEDVVFDETWVSVGIGAGLVPSYSGSDDYVFFPLPLIVGRVGGVGISPNGPGLALNLNSAPPSTGERETSFSFGPTFRIRNDRVAQIEDEVVEQLEDLDLAIEVGGSVGVSFPGVLNRFDSLSLSTQVRWDIAGAHDGMLVEPSIGYTTPLSRGILAQLSFNAQFVDDSFADYYYTVTPGQSAASGLPVFQAEGGLNSLGTLLLMNFDLDGNSLNGGFGINVLAGYSRLMGDGADTPFTAQRGSADQFISGIGIGYTF